MTDKDTDITHVRQMTEERSESDPLAAMALDGCVDEITRLRKSIAAMQPVSVGEAARVLVEAYDRDCPMRTADFHAQGCQCLRCAVDALRAFARSDREEETDD